MKKTWVTGLTAVILVGSFSGCSGKSRLDVLEDNQEVRQAQAEIEQDRQNTAQKRLEKIQKATPGWYLNSMPADATGVYAVGAGVAPQMNQSMEMAALQAEFDLAKTFGQRLSGGERSYEKVSSTGNIHQYTKLIDKIVDSVPVVGFEVIHRTVVPIGDRVYVWTMLKLPYDEFNRALGQIKDRNAGRQIDKEFDDLQQRLEQFRRSQKRNG